MRVGWLILAIILGVGTVSMIYAKAGAAPILLGVVISVACLIRVPKSNKGKTGDSKINDTSPVDTK